MPPAATTTMKTKDLDTIRELDELGFKYHYEPEFDLGKLDLLERRVQVRDDLIAPKELVKEMAVQIGVAQADFPAIVVSKDHYLVDGNTRVAAKQLRKDPPFFPALVLDEDYATASDKRKLEFEALALTYNGPTSKGLTARERKHGVEKMLKLDWTAEQIARRLGIGSGTVSTIKRELEAKRRLTMMGMSVNGNLQPASLRALGTADVIKLNDPAFRGLTELATEAGWNSKEIIEAGKALRESGSDGAAVAWLEKMRAENLGRIRQKALTGNGQPPLARQLRQRLGFIVNNGGDAADLVEKNIAAAPEHLVALDKSIAILTEAARQQREWLAQHAEEVQ